MDAVVEFGHFYGFLPLAGGLVELVEKVVALAFLVQLLSLLLEERVRVSAVTAPATTGPTADINQPMTKTCSTPRTGDTSGCVLRCTR